MELNGRPIKDEEPLPDLDELVYERSLFAGLLQLHFTREDGKPITNKREAKTVYKLQNKALEASVLEYHENCQNLKKGLQPVLKAVNSEKLGPFTGSIRKSLLAK